MSLTASTPDFRHPTWRWGFLLMALLVALATLLALLAFFLWLDPGSGRQVEYVRAGEVKNFSVGEPVRLPEQHFWLVRLSEREFVALSDRDPRNGCTVPWRPDFNFQGKSGWFRDPCHGSTYDLTGKRVFGPSQQDMDRFPLIIEGDQILVDTSKLCNQRNDSRYPSDSCLSVVRPGQGLPLGP